MKGKKTWTLLRWIFRCIERKHAITRNLHCAIMSEITSHKLRAIAFFLSTIHLMPDCQRSFAVFPNDHSSHNNLSIYSDSLTRITLRAPSGRRTLSLSDCRTWYRSSCRRTYFRTTRIQRVWIAAYWSCFERSGAWCYFHVLSCRLSRRGGQIGWSRIAWG